MSKVVPIRPPRDLDALWQDYASLQADILRDPSLAANRNHIDRTLRAYARYRDAFLAAL